MNGLRMTLVVGVLAVTAAPIYGMPDAAQASDGATRLSGRAAPNAKQPVGKAAAVKERSPQGNVGSLPTPNTSGITDVTTDDSTATIIGRLEPSEEIVLRIHKTKGHKEHEWTNYSPQAGLFTAVVRRSDKIRLEGGEFGSGIVFRVAKVSGGVSQVNIALTPKGPYPPGAVHIRPSDELVRKPRTVEIADIKTKDGTMVPISVLIRKHVPRPVEVKSEPRKTP